MRWTPGGSSSDIEDRRGSSGGGGFGIGGTPIGSSQLRSEWFERGFDAGQISDCDTFASGAVR
jgi:predicted metalloprotease